VTVTDDTGAQATASINVVVAAANSALTVDITAPSGTSFPVNQAIGFAATPVGGQAPYTLLWSFGDNSTAAGSSYDKTYTAAGSYPVQVTVTDDTGAQANDSINLTITTGTTPQTLTISDLRVTDVGTDRATIRWTTNLPADSRVIYDTASHPDITQAAAPNYGYVNSTSVSDTALVTDHAVTVTGLAASTKYYFRAISQRP
jgi:hypothetical protein